VVLSDSNFDKVIYINNPTEAENLSEAIENGCLKFQTVVKAIVENSGNKTPQLITITQNAFSIESEQLNLAGSLLTGMVRTLRNEHPELNAMSIDMDEESIEKTIDVILQPNNNVHEYLIRANEVNTQIISKSTSTISTSNIQFDKEACFLITGGTSGLGLAMAEWLQKQGVQKLALISRSGAKPETQAAIERIEAGGGQAKVYKSDIGDAAQVQNLITAIEADFGKVSGVVHAAGLLDDGTFTNLSRNQFLNVAQPKVNGVFKSASSTFKSYLDSLYCFFVCSKCVG
jgi:hypothetical protein